MTRLAMPLGVLAFIFTSASTSSAQVPSQPYELIDIGVLEGRLYSAGVSVSNTGYVAGLSSSLSGQQAFVWHESTGIRGLDHPTGGGDTVASDVNDAGQVIGTAFSSANGIIWNADGSVANVFASSAIDQPTAINNAGSVTGYRNVGSSQSAYVWNGSYSDLGYPSPAMSSQGYDINNLGQVAGTLNGGQAFGAFSSAPAAFLWTPSQGFVTIQSTGGFDSIDVRGLSDTAVVVGVGGNNAAWSWSLTRGFTLLSGLSGMSDTRALGVNNDGLIVGNSGANGVVWDASGNIFNVNALLAPSFRTWHVTTIRGVNDHGWLTGEAVNAGGVSRAVLLRPVPSPSSACGLGAAALLALRRRR
jgi:uncharacterized membrane protein